MTTRISPDLNQLPMSAAIHNSDPVAPCECGGALYVEGCKHHGGYGRFHCRSCGYCGTYARRYLGEVPLFHWMRWAA